MTAAIETEGERRQMLLGAILEITDRERARMSRSLHEGLCQELTAIAFLLKAQAKACFRENSASSKAFQEAAEAVNRNAGLARDFARDLHPFELSGGLPEALRELCARTHEKVPCSCEAPRIISLQEDHRLHLYRIAQEALANALRHGKPRAISIALARRKEETVLTVADNGKATVTKLIAGGGIHMMQYRANAMGGALKIAASRGRGTTVTCRVPLK